MFPGIFLPIRLDYMVGNDPEGIVDKLRIHLKDDSFGWPDNKDIFDALNEWIMSTGPHFFVRSLNKTINNIELSRVMRAQDWNSLEAIVNADLANLLSVCHSRMMAVFQDDDMPRVSLNTRMPLVGSRNFWEHSILKNPDMA